MYCLNKVIAIDLSFNLANLSLDRTLDTSMDISNLDSSFEIGPDYDKRQNAQPGILGGDYQTLVLLHAALIAYQNTVNTRSDFILKTEDNNDTNLDDIVLHFVKDTREKIHYYQVKHAVNIGDTYQPKYLSSTDFRKHPSSSLCPS